MPKFGSIRSFGLGEYAETVGPQGLLFIIKGRAPRNVNALAVLDL